MPKLMLATAMWLLCLSVTANAQSTLKLRNNTSHTIYAAYCIYEGSGDGWVTHGWYKVDGYDERKIDLDDYAGSVYIHGQSSEGGLWGGDNNFCIGGGSSGFSVENADRIRCEQVRSFSKTKVSKGGTTKWTFNP